MTSRKTLFTGAACLILGLGLRRRENLAYWLEQRAEEREGVDVGTGIIKRRGGRLRFLPADRVDEPLTMRERLLTPFWLLADPVYAAYYFWRYERER